MSIFTPIEKTRIRKFMGYPPIGTDANNILFGYITNQPGVLEARMDRLTDEEMSEVRKYLTKLIALEELIYSSSENQDTLQVAVLKLDPREEARRVQLYNYFRKQLGLFMGLPTMFGAGSRSMVV